VHMRQASILASFILIHLAGCSGKKASEPDQVTGGTPTFSTSKPSERTSQRSDGNLNADDAEDRAVKAIEELGGKVTRDEKADGEPVISVDLRGTKVTDAGLKVLKDLRNLQTLELAGTEVTDAGLKDLKDLKNLHELYLSGTKVTDTGL